MVQYKFYVCMRDGIKMFWSLTWQDAWKEPSVSTPEVTSDLQIAFQSEDEDQLVVPGHGLSEADRDLRWAEGAKAIYFLFIFAIRIPTFHPMLS